MLVADFSCIAFSHNHLSCLRDSIGGLDCYRILGAYWSWYWVIVFLFHVNKRIIMLSFRYLENSGDTVLILNLQFETNSGSK